MALLHASPGSPVDVGPLGPQLATQRTAALFKSRDLEVIRLVLRAGQSLPAHDVPGEITIQCIEGSIEIGHPGGGALLEAGQMLFLEGGVRHDLQARSDASALVTIALRS